MYLGKNTLFKQLFRFVTEYCAVAKGSDQVFLYVSACLSHLYLGIISHHSWQNLFSSVRLDGESDQGSPEMSEHVHTLAKPLLALTGIVLVEYLNS